MKFRFEAGPRPRGDERARRGGRRAVTLLVGVALAASGTLGAATAAQAAGTAPCATGTAWYWQTVAENGGAADWYPAAYSNWTLSSGTTVLDQGTTDANGAYKTCKVPSAGTAAKLEFFSAYSGPDGKGAVRWGTLQGNAGSYYSVAVPVSGGTLSADGQTRTLANVEIPNNKAGAWHIVATVAKLAAADGSLGQECWSMSCTNRTLDYRWGTNYRGGGVWNDSTGKVELDPGDVASQHLLLHEGGHWYQWALAGSFPTMSPADSTGCAGHTSDSYTNSPCAWTEGFANAIGAYAFGDRSYVFPDGYVVTFDTRGVDGPVGAGKGVKNVSGDNSEYAVTAALLQLWNTTDASAGKFLPSRAVLKTSGNTLRDYVTGRAAAGLPSALPVLAAYGIIY